MASTGVSEGDPGEASGEPFGDQFEDQFEDQFGGALTEDAFLGGRLRLLQPAGGYRAGTDAILLAAAAPAWPGEAALELGCGAGAAILAVGTRVGGLALSGLEIQPAYAALARANAARNGLALEVVEGDVAAPPGALSGRVFDLVLMNPPYFDRRASTRAADAGRDASHGEGAPLASWLALAARRLRPGGRLALIQRIARLPEILAGLPPAMGSVEVLPLGARDGAEPASLILRARKGGRAPFRLLPPLALHPAPGADAGGRRFAPAVEAALREAAALPWN